jgi:O-succinylbenzoic acid--CoA ligase
MPGGPAFAGALRRCWDAGDAVLPLDLRLPQAAQQRLLQALRPAIVLDESGSPTTLPGAEPVEDGDALVVATSGTTGEAKGAVLTRSAVEASARATSGRVGVDPARDRWLACLPLAHVGGLSVVTRAVVTGTAVEIQPRFAVEDARRAAIERGATLVSLVPAALSRLGLEGAALFRTIVVGGQRPPADAPPNVLATYGMTETGSGVVYDGVALEGVEVRTDAGEVWLRCPMLLRCYRDGTDPKTPDGWFATGDAGALDAAGRLQIHGRLDDVVISGGENIWPVQVEAVLRTHPSVADVAVGGRPDPAWGARLVAYVVPSPLAQETDPAVLLAQLRELVKGCLAPFAAPREIVVVAQLPRTAIGKVRRAELATLDGLVARTG